MYALLWFEDCVRLKLTKYLNISKVYCLLCDSEKNIDSRTQYEFEPANLIADSFSKCRNTIASNWSSLFNQLSHDIPKETTLVFPFSSIKRDFLTLHSSISNTFEFKATAVISRSGMVNNRTFEDSSPGAENTWKMLKILKGMSNEQIVDSSKVPIYTRYQKPKPIKRVFNTVEFIRSQLGAVSDKLGYLLEGDSEDLVILTPAGRYYINLTQRPMTVSKLLDDTTYKTVLSWVYSPLDALIMIYRQEQEEVSKLDRIRTINIPVLT